MTWLVLLLAVLVTVLGEGCIAVLQQTATLAKEWINKAISDVRLTKSN